MQEIPIKIVNSFITLFIKKDILHVANPNRPTQTNDNYGDHNVRPQKPCLLRKAPK